MANTPRLAFPEISSSQSQKEVTHNAALKMLDSWQFCAVQDKDLDTPPGGESNGQSWIVAAAGAAGAWATHEKAIAQYYNSAWTFYTPLKGYRAYIKDEDITYVYSGSAWVADRALHEKVQVITPADAPTINWALRHIATILLDRALTTFTFSGALHGDRLILRLKQDGTGSRLAAWPGTVRYGTDITEILLTTTVSKQDYVGFIYDGDATKYDVVSMIKGF